METTSGSSSMDWGALIASLKLETVLSVLLTLVICLVAMRLIRILLQKVLQKTTLEQRIQKYVLGALRAVMWIVTVLIVADQLGIPITSLVALLSILSLGVSLAVQTMLSNVAGGLVILSAKPFQVGDYIQTDSGEGIVRGITLTHTQLDTRNGLRVVIPNNSLSAGKITNWSTLGRLRVVIPFGASYDASVAEVKAACMAAVGGVDGILPDPEPAVHVERYGESNIDYAIYCWCSEADYWSVYYGLTESLQGVFAEAKVEFSYQHLNVHIVDK